MSKPLIFSLRPEPDCDEDILSLRQAGLNAESLPMLAIQRGGIKYGNKAICHAALLSHNGQICKASI